MSLVRWFDEAHPFAQLVQVQRELDRAFGGFGRGAWDTWGQPRAGVYPALNVYDDGESFIVRAEAPGLDKKSLDVTVTGSTLTLKGSRRALELPKGASLHRREREEGEFHRSLNLPEAVAADKVLATYQDGILEVRLPRAPEARARKVKIEG